MTFLDKTKDYVHDMPDVGSMSSDEKMIKSINVFKNHPSDKNHNQ